MSAPDPKRLTHSTKKLPPAKRPTRPLPRIAESVDRSEDVILVDSAGNQIGTAAKAAVHHRNTPLHLAFSAYVVDGNGAVLLTRRAHSKRTWPGELTNSCCGHPMPGEPMVDAVFRRVRKELGLKVVDVDLILPWFSYHARMATGTAENEVCPVFRVTTIGSVQPDAAEVGWTGWVSWTQLHTGVTDGSLQVSPWCRAQVAQLHQLGPSPLRWPTSDLALLPPAALSSSPRQ